MKTIWKELVLAVLMGIVMPGILLGVAASREIHPNHGATCHYPNSHPHGIRCGGDGTE